MIFSNYTARKSLLLLTILLTAALLTSSCITTFNPKKTMVNIVRTVNIFKPSYTAYRKKVCITRFENQTPYISEKFIALINQNLMGALNKKNANLILWEETENSFSDLKNKFPLLPTGEIDNLALAQRGRQLDLNVIIIGAITNIRAFEKKKGFWFLRKPVQYIEVHIKVQAYDTRTSAKFFEQSTYKNIKVDKQIFDKFNATPPEMPVPVIEKALVSLSKKMGEDIGHMLKFQQFNAYIKTISNNRITIGAGENSRIKPGIIFNVYNASKIITGKNGHRFYQPGTKTGAIKIIEVLPETSVGTVVEGKVEGMGSCLIPKY